MTLSISPVIWVPVLFFYIGFFIRPFYEHSILKEWNNLLESWMFCEPDFHEKK